MSAYVNIHEIADQVLASVEEESRTKTASVASSQSRLMPLARDLKKLAEDLRQTVPEEEVTEEDLAALMQDAEVQELMQALEANPELLQQLLAQEGTTEDGAMPPVADPSVMPPGMPAQMSDPAAMDDSAPVPQKAAQLIRKIAADLKITSAYSKQRRLVKAAQMLHAATGLQHLTEGLK